MKRYLDKPSAVACLLLPPVAVLYLPFTYHQTYGKYSLFQTLVLALIVTVLMNSRRRSQMGAARWLLVVYLVLSFVSCVWAFSRVPCLCANVPLVFYIVWALLISWVCDATEKQRILLASIVVSGVILAAVGLLLFCIGWVSDPGLRSDPTFRLVVPWRANPNLTAALMITPLIYAGLRCIDARSMRVLWDMLFAFLLFCFILTRSASGAVGAIAAAGTILLIRVSERWRRLLVRVLLVTVLVGLMVVWLVPQTMERIRELSFRGTNVVRYYLWQDAVRMIAARPFIGWGTGNFIAAYPQFRLPEENLYPLLQAIGNHAHNELLEVAVETGVVGAGLYLAFIWLLLSRFVKGIQSREDYSLKLPVVAGFVGMAVQGCFYVGLRFWDVAPFFWTHVGLLLAMTRGEQASEDARTGMSAGRCVFLLGGICCAVLWLKTPGDFLGQVELARGYKAYMTRRNEAAIPHLRRALRLNAYFPDKINAACYLAQALAAAGNLDEAISVLEALQKEANNVGNSRLVLAKMYYARFRMSQERDDLQRAKRNLVVYMSANKSEEAERLFREVCALLIR